MLPEVADQIGIRRSTPVITGSPDHQCACVGSGAVRDYEGHLYVGTSSWLECMVPFKKTDILHSIASFPSAIPGRYQCINEQDLAGGCLQFLLDNIYNHDNTADQPERCVSGFDDLNRSAEKAPPGCDRLIFTPWLNGERTPVDDPMLRGGFHNLSKTTTRDHLTRAVMEGVAYNTRWMLHYTERFTGHRLSPLNIVGGAAQSDLWCQIFADILQREIRRVSSPIHANARGAAFIALVGIGRISFEDIPNRVHFDRIFHPSPENKKTYDLLYKTFRRIHKANRSIYQDLNAKGSAKGSGLDLIFTQKSQIKT